MNTNTSNIIAEFMGWKPSVINHHGINLYYLPNDETGNFNYKCKQIDIEDMNYHTSWDWLMPVIEKIEKLSNIVLESITLDGLTTYNILIHLSNTAIQGTNKLEITYKAVIEFINWYNNNSKN